MEIVGGTAAFLLYTCAYTLATLGCGAGLWRARKVQDPDTRRGLVGLLGGSFGWAALELAYIVAPRGLKYGLYLGSLVVGLTTVGGWLYFCSAYTGRSFHRNQRYRRAAAAVYLLIVGVKLTNPVHGLYFQTTFVTEPFPHLTIAHQTFHWLVTGLSYALVAVGFFMLLEKFLEADYDTRPLGVLVGVTGLPVILDIVGFASERLIDFNYEPLGVAVFAVGVLYLYADQFLAVQLTDGVDEAVVYLTDDGRIKECNERAERLFPSLAGSTGESFEQVLPAAADALDDEVPVVERTRGGDREYYLVSETAFSLGQTDVGRMLVLTDVTDSERKRRELERQNEQLEDFAAAIRHELLNTLQIVRARVDIAGEAVEEGNVSMARDSLRTASETADRMSDIVDDLARLARHGQTPDEFEPVAFRPVAETAADRADTNGLAVSVEAEGEVLADPDRLRELLESAFVFAEHNGASSVEVRREADEILIADDGEPPGDADPEKYFEYGSAVPDAEAGLTLPNVRMLAETHGWEAGIDADYDSGVRLVLSDVTVRG